MRHYLLQILDQEEDFVGIPTIMPHLQKVIRQVYRVCIIGVRYRHDCDQFTYGIYVSLTLYLHNM